VLSSTGALQSSSVAKRSYRTRPEPSEKLPTFVSMSLLGPCGSFTEYRVSGLSGADKLV
jgi:hypothetical protein